MKTVFTSEDIRFVEVTDALTADYLTMVNDYENVGRFIGDNKKTYTEEQERRWIRSKLKEKAPVFSMIDKESGRFIGNVELMDVSDGEGELGIAITAGMQDRGRGTQAVKAMTAYGIERLGLKRIRLRARPFNARAIRVYEKCGFREYKRDENHVYMEYLPPYGAPETAG